MDPASDPEHSAPSGGARDPWDPQYRAAAESGLPLEDANLEPCDLEPLEPEPGGLEAGDLEPIELGPTELGLTELGPPELGPPEPGPGHLEPLPEPPFEQLHPGFVGAERVGNFIGVLVVLAIALGVAAVAFAKGEALERPWPWIFAGAALLIGLLSLQAWSWPPLTYSRTRYRLGSRALEIRRGVLVRRWIAVPRSRIQHTDVSSGPIQRRYGVATLTVNTAGTSNASIGLSGLSDEAARAMRDELMAGLEGGADDGV